VAVSRLIRKWHESFCANDFAGEKNIAEKIKKTIRNIRAVGLNLKVSK